MRNVLRVLAMLLSMAGLTSVSAIELETLSCEPELASGFDVVDGALDLDSSKVIAIDPVRSADVMLELARKAPVHYLTLLSLVSFDGQVEAVPIDPLDLTVYEAFPPSMAVEVQHYLTDLVSSPSNFTDSEVRKRNLIWNRVRESVESDATIARSCAVLQEDTDTSTLWISHGTENCLQLIRQFRSGGGVQGAEGSTRIDLALTEEQNVEVVVTGAPWPVIGSALAPQYRAVSATVF